ncbi:hypothetical protein [Paenibacillus puldeungensis]|uniref:hypothetical protein n=1 Tax=Paenibacillus puldeungensis TaxID=696536 RepID=UPI0036D35C7E
MKLYLDGCDGKVRTGKISKMLNVLWTVILLCVWGSVFIVHGLASSVAWAVAKMHLAPAGVILVLIYLIGATDARKCFAGGLSRRCKQNIPCYYGEMAAQGKNACRMGGRLGYRQ